MTKDTFGESLKREREMRGVTLEEISLATRIATRFLRAIESEEWDQLPGGVFNRGFVRSFARYLGLDEENTVAEYTLAVGDRPSVPVWTGSPPVVTPERHPVAWTLAAIFFLALLAGAWFGTRRFLAWRAAKRTAQATEMSSASSPVSTSTPLQQSASDPAGASSNGAPAPSDQDATSVGQAAATVSPSATAPISPAAEPFELKIEAGKKTKVTVVADKDVVFDGTIKAGENHSFTATDHFQVSAKDAGALRLALNGKAIAPIGPAGRAGKITLTRDALKAAAGGGN
jgi:cytoskeleton protein RodZ